MKAIALSMALVTGVALADTTSGVNALGRGDYQRALVEFRPGAEQGDPSAQNFLAYTYSMLEQYEQAYAWYHLSAECGSIDAEIDRDVLAQKMSVEEIERGRVLGLEFLSRYCLE